MKLYSEEEKRACSGCLVVVMYQTRDELNEEILL